MYLPYQYPHYSNYPSTFEASSPYDPPQYVPWPDAWGQRELWTLGWTGCWLLAATGIGATNDDNGDDSDEDEDEDDDEDEDEDEDDDNLHYIVMINETILYILYYIILYYILYYIIYYIILYIILYYILCYIILYYILYYIILYYILYYIILYYIIL